MFKKWKLLSVFCFYMKRNQKTERKSCKNVKRRERGKKEAGMEREREEKKGKELSNKKKDIFLGLTI